MSTTATPVTAPPTRKASRLAGIDATRGLAILGMMAVHSLNEYDDAGDPTWMYSLSAGRAAAIFAVLAGVSIAFISKRRRQHRGPEATGISASLAARAVVIGLIGLFLGYTEIEFGVVILTYYAVMFLLAIPLIYLSTRTLVVLTVAAGLLLPAASQLLRPVLPEFLDGQLSFSHLVHDPLGVLATLVFTGEFPALVWMTYVGAGLVVGRLTLSSLRVAASLFGTGLALMLGSAVVSWALLNPFGGLDRIDATTDDAVITELLLFGGDGTVPTTTWWWLGVNGPHTGTPFDLMATIGSSLAVLGVALLLGHVTQRYLAIAVRVLFVPLTAIGSMSLTAYVGHIAFINSDFDVYGPWSGYLRQVVVMILLAIVWRATAGRGPLEGLVTAVTTRAQRRARDWARHRTATSLDA
ncbi:heparan-alpha-glucosaminide N-acetyltransferase domain-containing protein [Rhodococcus kronopolitis]|uniref:Heparan-alpha-glucosaminide N-acetyltransferase domain-containing protein n=1 Tax=Rhodococcus kronopolitis TaxID=1460226 RepID=A0ABV9FRD5_9NOCA